VLQEVNKYNSVYNKIMVESGNRMPGRPFEYVQTNVVSGKFINKDYLELVGHENYTNLRNIHKNNIQDSIIKQPKHFLVITGRIPKFVYDHIRTHTRISWMSETVRVKEINEVKFWRPDHTDNVFEYLDKQSLSNYEICKFKGYKDEIAARELSSRRYVNFIAAGFINEYAWEHFVIERTKKSTQKPTQEFAQAVKQLSNYKQNE